MFGGLWAGTLYIHFWGSCPLTEFCQVENSLSVQVLHSPILAALLHGTRAAAVSQTLWHGTRDGIMELLQRAPPVFGWAAMTSGIGPHSSCCYYCDLCLHTDGRMMALCYKQLKNLMVVGVDTYHDSAKKGRSVGAFVASMNQRLTRYYSNCGFQSSHEELQNNLCTFMLSTSPLHTCPLY